MEHLIRDCKKIGKGVSTEDVVSGRKDKRIENWLRNLKWKRNVVEVSYKKLIISNKLIFKMEKE